MKLTPQMQETIITELHEAVPNLKALYIFGSFADDTVNRESDIDIAYLAEDTLNNIQRWEIAQALARRLNIDVDLVDLKTTNTVFRFQIISTGKRIFGDGYDVEEFEMLSYSFYLRFQEERQSIIDAVLADKKVLKSA